MKLSTLWYCFMQGLKNIKRNLVFSLASVGTIIACLFLFGIFYSVVLNARAMMDRMQEAVSVSVFFDYGITAEEISAIGEEFRVWPGVNTMDFMCAVEAWADYSKKLYDNNPEMVEQAFGTDNPLAGEDSYNITINDASKQAEFVKFLEEIPGVRKVKNSAATAQNIASMNSLVAYASVAIIIILLLVSIFLISNTITIGITVRKDEIAVMKLIGATDFFVRTPFIVEGITIGLVGSVIPGIMLFYMYGAVVDYLTTRFSVLKAIFTFLPRGDVFSSLLPLCLVVGVGIGLIGSLMTTKKHLKV